MRVDADEMQVAHERRKVASRINDMRGAEDGGVRRFDVHHALADSAGRQVTGAVNEDLGLVR
jgi:hypothetical protein